MRTLILMLMLALVALVTPGCLSTENCGRVTGALVKPGLEPKTRCVGFARGVALALPSAILDVVFLPAEILKYDLDADESERTGVTDLAWNFTTAWQKGYDRVGKYQGADEDQPD